MAKFFDPTYDPRVDSASSAVEISDLNPEKGYDTDLRRIGQEDRESVEDINKSQNSIGKYFRAAKTAGAYRTRAGIAEPTIRGKTPRTPAIIDGSEIPSMGDAYGPVGSTNYANKPGRAFGNI